MTAFFDASCPKCGKRFGWQGSPSNYPGCPRCGHRPPREELDAVAAEIEAIRHLLATAPKDASCKQRRQQRLAAGLTLRQTAKQLGISASDLADIEAGRVAPSTDALAKMAEIYGILGDRPCT